MSTQVLESKKDIDQNELTLNDCDDSLSENSVSSLRAKFFRPYAGKPVVELEEQMETEETNNTNTTAD